MWEELRATEGLEEAQWGFSAVGLDRNKVGVFSKGELHTLDLGEGRWRKEEASGAEPEGLENQGAALVGDALILAGGVANGGGLVPGAHVLWLSRRWWSRFDHRAPSARRFPYVARHSSASRAVLWGGVGPSGEWLDDLWVFHVRQERWERVRELTSRESPPPRLWATLTQGPSESLLLYGGHPGSGYSVERGVWQLRLKEPDGPGFMEAEWNFLAVTGGKLPRPRVGHAATYVDGVGLLICGGWDAETEDPLYDTWLLTIDERARTVRPLLLEQESRVPLSYAATSLVALPNGGPVVLIGESGSSEDTVAFNRVRSLSRDSLRERVGSADREQERGALKRPLCDADSNAAAVAATSNGSDGLELPAMKRRAMASGESAHDLSPLIGKRVAGVVVGSLESTNALVFSGIVCGQVRGFFNKKFSLVER